MNDTKRAKAARPSEKPTDLVGIMCYRTLRQWVNTIAQATGENAPDVLQRLAKPAIYEEFRKILQDS